MHDVVDSAIEAEALAADGLLGLSVDAKKCNVHFTHVATKSKKDVQPHQLSREQFWQHLCRCFRKAFPRAESATGSILEFGLTCKERHHNAPREVDRKQHHHAATHASNTYRWKTIANISRKEYGIHLNAVAHDTYTTMFCYLRCPTIKKPIHELDPEPFFSPTHPQGEKLRELLKNGDKYKVIRQQKKAQAADGSDGNGAIPVRSQFGIVFNWVTEKNLRKRKGAKQFEADAVTELKAGRPQLLDFCKKHKNCLEDQLDYIWELADAGLDVHRLEKTLLDLLVEAAKFDSTPEQLAEACKNKGCSCCQTYDKILDHHRLDASKFCYELYETLKYGRRKGNAFMVVGGRDTGKTTVTQPLEEIYKCMGCPQSDSFCPLEKIRGHDVLLWQDLRYNPGHPQKDGPGLRLDIGTWNRLLEGVPTPIGVPKTDGRSDFTYTENAPLIATGPFQPIGYKNGFPDDVETAQINCRIKFWLFSVPPPETGLNRGFKVCTVCWSRWLLRKALEYYHEEIVDAPDSFLDKVSEHFLPPLEPDQQPERPLPVGAPQSSGPAEQADDQFSKLRQLVQWRSEGALTETEFKQAKGALGLK
jgi:hypothetical protein